MTTNASNQDILNSWYSDVVEDRVEGIYHNTYVDSLLLNSLMVVTGNAWAPIPDQNTLDLLSTMTVDEIQNIDENPEYNNPPSVMFSRSSDDR
jgi:hypothetical protein